MAEAAFFDLDGCLVDSRGAIAACMNQALEAVDLPAVEDRYLHGLIGPPLKSAFTAVIGRLGGDPQLAVECVHHYRAVYPEISLRRTVVMPGIRRLFCEHLDSRLILAVVTSKPREFAEPLLDALGLVSHFGAVFAPSLEAMDEPKEAALRRALAWAGMQHFGSEPRRAWMIGDRRYDIDAGRACGIATAGVTWGIGDRPELVAAQPTAIVDTPDEMRALLDIDGR